jgi:phospholipase B1
VQSSRVLLSLYSLGAIYTLCFLTPSSALDPASLCLNKSNYTDTALYLQGLHNRYPHQDMTKFTDLSWVGEVNNFTCGYLPPSEKKPSSVHELRPGDVNVIAALGDSITAANGAGAHLIPEVALNYRGLSWSIGGKYYGNEDVSSHFTLPNALKRYNPDIAGWAAGIATPNQDNFAGHARLDIAVQGSKAIDMPGQARKLIEDIKNNPDYNYEEDWKVVTLFIGGNNLCQYCINYYENTPEVYVKEIQQALDILHENLPKALINVATILNIDQVAYLGQDHQDCVEAHLCMCYCPLRTEIKYQLELQHFNDLYKSLVWDLIATERYDTREDFTVVIQPFFEDTVIPLTSEGYPDLTYFAPDCFHFSKKGHNYAGEALWNNMFQRVGHKSRQWFLGESLKCPTEETPFIWTNINSL